MSDSYRLILFLSFAHILNYFQRLIYCYDYYLVLFFQKIKYNIPHQKKTSAAVVYVMLHPSRLGGRFQAGVGAVSLFSCPFSSGSLFSLHLSTSSFPATVAQRTSRRSIFSFIPFRSSPCVLSKGRSKSVESLSLPLSSFSTRLPCSCSCCSGTSDVGNSARLPLHRSSSLPKETGSSGNGGFLFSRTDSRFLHNSRSPLKLSSGNENRRREESLSSSSNGELMQENDWEIIHHFQHGQPPRGSGIQPLLDNNKVWAEELRLLNPSYFTEMSHGQYPQYLWIGCSDSRVPANELVGLHPGNVFVHRNVGNVVCNSDLNVLAVLQYAVDCLKVEHVIVAGHSNCGGVTAALYDQRVGLADHWILHISTVKKRHWKKMKELIPLSAHLDALCQLNVLAQVENIVDTHLIRRIWDRQNAEEHKIRSSGKKYTTEKGKEVDIHGWVYSIETGHIIPLLTLNRHSNIELELREAHEALFTRFSQMR